MSVLPLVKVQRKCDEEYLCHNREQYKNREDKQVSADIDK